jgi:uncharacterized protein (TIGR02996 family)
MSTLDALRQAVLASPDDDLPRLVFADYLEETGDPDRAAFIRAQIELAKTPEYEPFAVLCKTRKREWLTGDRWAGDQFDPFIRHSTYYPEPQFRRGFQWCVGLAYPQHIDTVEHLLGEHPIESVHTRTGTLDDWRQFAAAPCLRRIHSVTLEGLTSPNEPLRCLRESPYTTGVTSLWLDHTNVPSLPFILADLFTAPLGRQLTRLTMRLGYTEHPSAADETLESIAQGDINLTDYHLLAMGIGPTAARVFADTGLAGRAEVLRLNFNALTTSGIAILATATDRLRVLELEKAALDVSSADPLALSPKFASLRKLILTGNWLGTDGIKMLARSPHLAGLRSLGLANTHCDNAAVRYLTRGTFWPNLVELDLRNNPISPTGAKHLLTARPAPDLTSLVLPTRNLTDDMRAELVAKFGEVVTFVE